MALAAELPAPTVDPDAVRRTAEEVLSRPEFAAPSPGPLTRLRQWVFEQLGRILEALLGTGRGSVVATVLLVAAVIVLVVLAVRFARGVRRDPSLEAAVSDQVGRPPRDWAAEADEHEAAGRRREAVRCRYRELVAELAARGVVDEVPGRTSGEYLAEVRRSAPRAADPVAVVTAMFEGAWYGRTAPTVADLDQVRAEAGAALEALDRQPAGKA